MLTQYNLKMPHAVYGGENAMDNITAIIKARGAKKVAMFTDKGIEGAGLFALPEEAVKASGAEYYVLDELPPEPSYMAVQKLLDEFSNIGQIPQFEKLIATIRSREISASIILQSKSQLKAIYKDNADTIEGNCDTTLFLGGKEKTTLKEMAEILGKETIDLYNTSDTRGTSQSYGLNYQKTGKELMSQDEIAVMDGGKCIMQLRGVRPFFSDKFDITKHDRYKELSDYDPKNAFDIEDYVKHLHHMKVTPATMVDDAFDCGEVNGQEDNSSMTTE